MIGVVKAPSTGGEIFNNKVFNYLKSSGVNVYSLSIPPERKWIPLPIRLLISNFRILLKIIKLQPSSAIIYEDCYSYPRLFLTNWWAAMKGHKIAMLMQISLNIQHRLFRKSYLRKINTLLLNYFLKYGDIYLANSADSKSELQHLGCDSNKIEMVGCGFDFKRLKEKPKFNEISSSENLQIIYVGNIQERKGVYQLVKAASKLTDINFVLIIVGNYSRDPVYYNRIKSFVTNNNLEQKISFLGRVSDDFLEKLYIDSDIFVLPSLHETFGIVLLEAMSFGLPIITTKVGAIPELVIDGKNGILVQPNDPDFLANAIRRLIISPKERKYLGNNGYEFIVANRDYYSWDSVGERILNALQEL